jgi:hypothetical protein
VIGVVGANLRKPEAQWLALIADGHRVWGTPGKRVRGLIARGLLEHVDGVLRITPKGREWLAQNAERMAQWLAQNDARRAEHLERCQRLGWRRA